MRFVAGRGAVAELLTGAVAELLLAWAPQWSTIGKILLAWALQRRAIRKMLLDGRGAAAKRLAGAPWRRGRQGTPQWQRGCWRGALRQSRGRRRGMAMAKMQTGKRMPAADWHGNARNAKEPAPTDGTGPSQTFGCIQAEQSLVEDFVCLFLLGMRIYI